MIRRELAHTPTMDFGVYSRSYLLVLSPQFIKCCEFNSYYRYPMTCDREYVVICQKHMYDHQNLPSSIADG